MDEAATRWQVTRTCFRVDIGTQRCRMPQRLVQSLKAKLGDVIVINFGPFSALCTVHSWPDQTDNCLQVDRTVISHTTGQRSDEEAIGKAVSLSEASFEVISEIDKLTSITVTLVLPTIADVRRFIHRRRYFTSLLPEALSNYVVRSGYEINCDRSDVCRLLRVALVSVVDCCSGTGPSSAGRTSGKTAVTLAEVISRQRFKSLTRTVAVPVLGGLDGPRTALHEALSFPYLYPDAPLPLPRGVLLVGPPGTGKTALVRSVVDQCRASLVYVAGPSLCRSEPGESEALLRRTFEQAVELSEEGPAVLFVDEVDSILGRKGSSGRGGQQAERLLAQMMTLMDGLCERGQLVVVGATNRPQALDPAVRRPGRFDQEIYMGAPTKEDRECILKLLTSKFPLDSDVSLSNIADRTPGFVGADLVLLCQEVASSKIYSSLGSFGSPCPVTEADFLNSLKTIRPSTTRGSSCTTDFQRIGWSDIGGLDDVKRQLVQAVEWPIKHKETFLRLGLRQPRGVLLYGPPGCCKTTLVRACATSCNSTFLHISSAQIYSSYLGDSEKAIAEAFQRGRVSAPTILFLDEIDSIVGKRDIGSDRGVHEKVLSTLLNEMDGIGVTFDSKQGTSGERSSHKSGPSNTLLGDVILIAATNRPDLLDEAILRPGRFDKLIYVPPPDHIARLQILEVITKKMPVKCDLEVLVKNTEGFTGADLENLCREAALQALTDEGFECPWIREVHFLTALKSVKPSVSDEQLQIYENLHLQIV